MKPTTIRRSRCELAARAEGSRRERLRCSVLRVLASTVVMIAAEFCRGDGACAQTPPAPEPFAPPEASADAPGAVVPPPSPRVIEEIVVTSQKQEQSLRDVPISVSVMDSEFLTEHSITDFRDVSRHTANFRVNNEGGNTPPPDIRIRGFGTARANRAFEQAVGLTIDGDTFGQQEFFRGALFDVSRIEVLKGPQGTFFGKNTTAGLVNLVLKNPTEEFEGFVDLQLGEFDRRRVEAAVGGPIVRDVVNFRIAGLTSEQDGYIENTTARTVARANDVLGGRSHEGLRAKLAFPNVWGVGLLLTGEQSEADNFGLPTEIVEAEPQSMRDFVRKYDPHVDLVEGNYVGSMDLPSEGSRRIQRFALNADTDWGGWGLNAVIGHSRLKFFETADVGASPAPSGESTTRDRGHQTTFEVRASSPSLAGLLGLGRLLGLDLGNSELTAGLYHQRRHYTTHTDVPLNFVVVVEQLAAAMGVSPSPVGAEENREGPYSTTTSDFVQDTRSYAGFAQMSWHLAEQWTLEPGFRATYETKDGNIARTYDSPASEQLFFQLANFERFDEPLSRSEPAFTPKIALIYDVTDDINLYGSWALGFKSGGFNENGTVVDGLTFKTEEMRAWEVGTKSRLLDGAATFNAALFWMNATDLQLYTFEPAPPDKIAGPILTTNAGEARSRGFEVDATWFPTSWLTVRDSLGFVDSEYLDFPIGSCEAGDVNTDGDSDLRCDLTGEPFQFTPKWVNSLTGSVRLPVQSLVGVELPIHGVDVLGGMTLHYEDVHFANDTSHPLTRQPSFFKVDGHVGFANAEQGWSAMVTGQNLTDEATYVTRTRLLSDGLMNGFVSPPRQIFGSIRWSF